MPPFQSKAVGWRKCFSRATSSRTNQLHQIQSWGHKEKCGKGNPSVSSTERGRKGKIPPWIYGRPRTGSDRPRSGVLTRDTKYFVPGSDSERTKERNSSVIGEVQNENLLTAANETIVRHVQPRDERVLSRTSAHRCTNAENVRTTAGGGASTTHPAGWPDSGQHQTLIGEQSNPNGNQFRGPTALENRASATGSHLMKRHPPTRQGNAGGGKGPRKPC